MFVRTHRSKQTTTSPFPTSLSEFEKPAAERRSREVRRLSVIGSFSGQDRWNDHLRAPCCRLRTSLKHSGNLSRSRGWWEQWWAHLAKPRSSSFPFHSIDRGMSRSTVGLRIAFRSSVRPPAYGMVARWREQGSLGQPSSEANRSYSFGRSNAWRTTLSKRA
jgi:hypothetical protein